MSVEGWKYYNHAMVPTCAPHESANIEAMRDKDFWNPIGGGTPLFARWTEDWDCTETEFWYTILDHPFDIEIVKSKHRYYIKQGIKNFDVRRLNHEEFEEYKCRLLEIINTVRVNDYHLLAVEKIAEPNENQYYLGAFDKEKGMLDGWALITEHDDYIELTSLKVLPECEKRSINAALVYGLINIYGDKLCKDLYICNGTRTINHPTQFNAYLRRMFEFRKAYCRLRIHYRWFVKLAVILLRPFRKRIVTIGEGRVGMIHQVASVMKMDEIARACSDKSLV